jgi:hypothetical protein
MGHAYAEGVALGVAPGYGPPRCATSPLVALYAEGDALGVWHRAVNGDGTPASVRRRCVRRR